MQIRNLWKPPWSSGPLARDRTLRPSPGLGVRKANEQFPIVESSNMNDAVLIFHVGLENIKKRKKKYRLASPYLSYFFLRVHLLILSKCLGMYSEASAFPLDRKPGGFWERTMACFVEIPLAVFRIFFSFLFITTFLNPAHAYCWQPTTSLLGFFYLERNIPMRGCL